MQSGRITAAPGPGGRSAAIVTLVSALSTAVAAPAAAQLSVQPVIVEMRVDGASASSTVLVRNEGTSSMALQVYAADFDQPEEGGHTFLPPGQHPRSCAGRVRFFPESFEVAAGGSQEVRLTMEPGSATCWSLVFVQTVPPESRGISVAQRIGVKVYGVQPDATPDGELRAVSLVPDPDAPGEMLLSLDFENLGEDPLRPEGELEVRTLEGSVVAVAPVPAFSVLPGHVRRAVVKVDLDLPSGEYLAIPILDFGGDYLAGGQSVFRIPES